MTNKLLTWWKRFSAGSSSSAPSADGQTGLSARMTSTTQASSRSIGDRRTATDAVRPSTETNQGTSRPTGSAPIGLPTGEPSTSEKQDQELANAVECALGGSPECNNCGRASGPKPFKAYEDKLYFFCCATCREDFDDAEFAWRPIRVPSRGITFQRFPRRRPNYIWK